jgi:hypothetical protein
MRDSGSKTEQMAMVSTRVLMEGSTKDIGAVTSSMDMALKFGQMVHLTRASTSME